MSKISVIVPVYKVEKYIERCARSLFNQTLDDIEYIFVDDCSPDKSIAILENIIKEYQPRLNKEHKNVRIEKMSQNTGEIRKSFITGVGKHNGELISLLDLNSITLEENA